jgi:hypothetical protein
LGLHGGVGALRKTRQGRSEAVGGQEGGETATAIEMGR